VIVLSRDGALTVSVDFVERPMIPQKPGAKAPTAPHKMEEEIMGIRRISLVLVALAAVSGIAGAGVWTEAGATTIPSVQATPSTNVADGQVISVTGSGFTPSATIAVIECQAGTTSETGCDLSTYILTTGSSTGGFTTPYVASRYIHTSSPTTVDCSLSVACILVAANDVNTSEAAAIPLRFNLSAVPLPALVLNATVSTTGTVTKKTGVATLSGTITCNRPVMVSVSGQLSQTYHRFLFTSYFSSRNVLCTSSTNWSVVVQPQNGLFGHGMATVTGYATRSVGGTSTQSEISGTVTLRNLKG
jgi:hypothetical protein